MVDLTLHEAQLFKLLSSFFGRDQVILKMSVLAVCGGQLPHPLPSALLEYNIRYGAIDLKHWAKSNTCLFTIVDHDDAPKMVVEFFSGFDDSIAVEDEEHQRILPALLGQLQIPYVTISVAELSEILAPTGTLDLCTLLEQKFSDALAELVT